MIELGYNIPDEKQANDLFDRIDAGEFDAKPNAEKQAALDQIKRFQIAQQYKREEAEREDIMAGYDSIDNVPWTPEDDAVSNELGTYVPDDKARRQNTRWLAHEWAMPEETVSENMDLLRPKMAEGLGIKNPELATDLQIYDALSARRKSEKEEEATYLSVMDRGIAAAIDGDPTQDFDTALSKSLGVGEQLSPERKRQFAQIYGEVQAMMTEHREVMEMLRDVAGKQTGLKKDAKTEKTLGDLADAFSTMNESDQDKALSFVVAYYRSQGKDKNFLYQLGESIGRGGGAMYSHTRGMFDEAKLEGIEQALKTTTPLYWKEGDDTSIAHERDLKDRYTGELPEGYTLVPVEHYQEALDGVHRLKTANQVKRKLRKIIESDVDPIKVLSKNAVLGWLEQGAYDAAGSIPYMVAAAVPYVGWAYTTSAMVADKYDDLRLRYPDMPVWQAQLISTAVGIPQGVIEKISAEQILTRIPGVRNFMEHAANPAAWRNFGKRWFEQWSEEMAQEGISIVFEGISASMGASMPGWNWTDQMRGLPGTAGQNAAATLFFALPGRYRSPKHGEGTLFRNVLDSGNRDQLAKFGYSEEQIASIVAAPRGEARDAVAAQEWSRRPENLAQEAYERAESEVKAEATIHQRAADAGEEVPVPIQIGDRFGLRHPDGKVSEYDTAEEMVAALQRMEISRLRGDAPLNDAMYQFFSGRTDVDWKKLDAAKGLNEFVKEGLATPEQVQARIDVAGIGAGHLAEVDGYTQSEIRDGILRHTIALVNDASPDVIVEEVGHTAYRNALARGQIKYNQFVDAVRAYGRRVKEFNLDEPGLTEETIRTRVDEGVADMVKATFFGRLREADQLQPGLRAFFLKMARMLKEIFRRAFVVKQMAAKGEISGEIQTFLSQASGLEAPPAVTEAVINEVEYLRGTGALPTAFSIRENEDYRGTHRPLSDEGGSARLHDLEKSFGSDIYGPNALQYFGSGDQREAEVLRIMKRVKGKPDAIVTIYRGIPKGGREVFAAGEWVTLSRKVAADYASLSEGGKVILKKVKASEVAAWADSLLEQGYFPETRTSFSIRPKAGSRVAFEPDIDRLAWELNRYNPNPEEKLEIRARTLQRIRELQNLIKYRESTANPELASLQATASLAVMVAAMPPEVRGKFPPSLFTSLQEKKRSGTRTAKLIELADKLDSLLEAHLKSEYTERIEDVFKASKAKDKKTGAGFASDYVNDALAAWNREKPEDSAAELEKLDKILRGEDPNIPATAENITKYGRLHALERLYGGHRGMSAERLADAWNTLKGTREAGIAAWRESEEKRKEQNKAMAEQAVKEIGVEPGRAAETRSLEQEDRVKRNLIGFVRGHYTLGQLLEVTFGTNSNLTKRFKKKLAKASGAAEDSRAAAGKRMHAAIGAAIGAEGVTAELRIIREIGKLRERKDHGFTYQKGRKVENVRIPIPEAQAAVTGNAQGYTDAEIEQLRDGLAMLEPGTRVRTIEIERELDPGKTTDYGPVSLDEMVYAVMTWDQEDGRRLLERQGISQDTIQAMRRLVFESKSAVATLRFLRDEYQKGHKPIDTVYRRMYGMPLPQIRNYSPLRVQMRGDESDLNVDGGYNAGGMSPGSLHSRVMHARPIDLHASAMGTFISHTISMSHWIAFAETIREMRAVMSDNDVMEAISVKYGEQAAQNLQQMIGIVGQDGVRTSAGASLAERAVGKFYSSAAISILGGSLRTIMMQSDNLMRVLLALPKPQQFMRAISLTLQDPGSVKKIWDTPTIQRRLENGFSPEVRAAMAKAQASPSTLLYLAGRGLLPMQYYDAAGMALTGTFVYQYHKDQFLKKGLTETAAERLALEEMDMAVATYGQPSTVSQRSRFEFQGTFAKVLFMFATDARAKAGIYMRAWGDVARGENVAENVWRIVWMNSLFMVGEALRDLWGLFTADDDDEVFEWEDYVRALVLGPGSGLFLAGAGLELITNAMTGGWIFDRSENPMKRVASDAVKIVTHPEKLVDPESAGKSWRAAFTAVAQASAMVGAPRTAIGAAGAAELTRVLSDAIDIANREGRE